MQDQMSHSNVLELETKCCTLMFVNYTRVLEMAQKVIVGDNQT